MTIEAYGGAELLTLEPTAEPQPGPGQVLTHLEAAGVNFIDVTQRKDVIKLLGRAADAHRDMKGRGTRGKLYRRPSDRTPRLEKRRL